MSTAYERVRAALDGTPLAGNLDRLNAELHLTPDAAEWVIAVLALVGSAPVRGDLQAVERALVRLPTTLDGAMKASGVEIVREFGDEIAFATTTAIKSCTLALMQRVADSIQGEVERLTTEASAATKSVTDMVGAEITATSSAMSQASSSLIKTADRLGGWTPARISNIALGVALAAGMYVAGNVAHTADVVFGCSSRAEQITSILKLRTRTAIATRNYICQGYR